MSEIGCLILATAGLVVVGFYACYQWWFWKDAYHTAIDALAEAQVQAGKHEQAFEAAHSERVRLDAILTRTNAALLEAEQERDELRAWRDRTLSGLRRASEARKGKKKK